jgi:hypothetical protein
MTVLNEGCGKKMFTSNALTRTGIELTEYKLSISLFADEDILFFAKNISGDPLIEEYFARNMRRHSLWKSDAEFYTLVDQFLSEELSHILDKKIQLIGEYIDYSPYNIIDDKFLTWLKKQKRSLESEAPNGSEEIRYKIDSINLVIESVSTLEKFSKDLKIKFDFVILSIDRSRSNFIKSDLENILIYFPSIDQSISLIKLGTLSKLIKPSNNVENKTPFFYIYYSVSESSDVDSQMKTKLIKNMILELCKT